MATSRLRHLLGRCISSQNPPSPSLLHPSPVISTARAISSSSAVEETSEIARSISSAVIKHAQSSTSDLPQHLSLHFSDVRFNTSLLQQILNISSPAGRSAIDLFRWAVNRRSFTPSDEALSHMVAFLGRRHDFKSINDLLTDFRHCVGAKTLRATFDRLIRAGRPIQAVRLFQNLETDYNIPQDRDLLTALVSNLSEHGFGSHAEKIVKDSAHKFFPNEEICYDLIRAWCVDGKLDQALRLMAEMNRGGFELGTPAYNSILDCICRLCRKKDPLRLQSEANKVLAEMESRRIPRDPNTFSILISNLCKLRKTDDAMELFQKMDLWGCSPTSEIYIALIKSLYQAARVAEGDQMVEKMKSEGFEDQLGTKTYYEFIKILCGIERIDHAMKVFRLAKGFGFNPGVKTYGLLVEKLWNHNQISRAKFLIKEAEARGIKLPGKEYSVDQRFLKVVQEKKKSTRLTFPEKMEKKKKRLRKLRLSFVRKPKGVRRAY